MTAAVATSGDDGREPIKRVRLAHSSNLESIGYDPERQEMHVTFLHGRDVYIYSNVSPDEWAAVSVTNAADGSSVGRRFARMIKSRKQFRCVPVKSADDIEESSDGQ